MPSLIKDGAVSNDAWTLLKEATDPSVLNALHGKNLIVPLSFWERHREELKEHEGLLGIWLESDQLVTSIMEELAMLPIIALNFPTFTDGRSYSNARQLRQEFAYEGEVRAIGDVLRDQLFYMLQCGFNSFSLRYDQDIEACLSAFEDFSNSYQATAINEQPLFRRR